MTGFLLTAKQKLMLCINKRLYWANWGGRPYRSHRSDRPDRGYRPHRSHRGYRSGGNSVSGDVFRLFHACPGRNGRTAADF